MPEVCFVRSCCCVWTCCIRSSLSKLIPSFLPFSDFLVLPNGDIEVGVHIADVTHFVPHNSPLDLEAQTRGTTFYLVDRRFDMLPSLLSSGAFSIIKKINCDALQSPGVPN